MLVKSVLNAKGMKSYELLHGYNEWKSIVQELSEMLSNGNGRLVRMLSFEDAQRSFLALKLTQRLKKFRFYLTCSSGKQDRARKDACYRALLASRRRGDQSNMSSCVIKRRAMDQATAARKPVVHYGGRSSPRGYGT